MDNLEPFSVRLARGIYSAFKHALAKEISDGDDQNQSEIIVGLLETWLEENEGIKESAFRSPVKAQKSITMNIPAELHRRLNAEVERRKADDLEPHTSRGVCETAIVEWLKKKGYPTGVEALDARRDGQAGPHFQLGRTTKTNRR